MFGNAMICFIKLFVFIVFASADLALAADPPSTNADAGIVVGPDISRAMPIGSPPVTNAEPVATDGSQISGVLREIGQRQSELMILELDLKRAELQKKLRELDSAPPAGVPQFLSTAATNMGWEGTSGPVVRRIHKIGNELVAMVVFPSGETKDVRSGGFVGNGLRIVEILSDAVYVRKGDQQRYALPVSPSRHGGP